MTPADQHALREALAFARFEETHERRRADNWRARALAAEAENTRLKETVEAARAALKPFCFGDPTLETILFGHMPDDATCTLTVKLRDTRAARSILATIPPKENPDA